MRLFKWSKLALLLLVALIAACTAGASFPASGEVPYRVERDVTYSLAEDIPLLMDIYYPRVSGNLTPAVVYIHGGGWYSGDKASEIGQYFIPRLVARGYFVAAINYRLAPRYQFPAQIEDVKCAVRYLRANAGVYGIDPEHIGAWGDSAGGHLAALLGVTSGCKGHPDSVQAVLDMYGPTDLTVFYENDNSPHIEHVFGTSDRNSETIVRASPVTHVSSDAPPFLMIHGNNDDVVPLYHSQAFYERLVSARVPAKLVTVDNCGHCFAPVGGSISPDRTEVAEILADFFDEHLR